MSSFAGRDVLPLSSTPLEEILADLRWDHISELDPNVIRAVVDPATCPAPLLPWLAWSMSVDVWDANWSDATKRRVIAASPEVHRRKGTRLAVRMALEALGARTSIREWWESSPPERRGTFKVTVFADGTGPILDLPMLKQLREAVKRSKPKSRVFELEIALQSETPILIAGTTRSIQRMSLLPRIDPSPASAGLINLAGAYEIGVKRSTLMPLLTSNTPARAPVTIAGAYARVGRALVIPPRS